MSLIHCLKKAARRKSGITSPEISEELERPQSTVDNWMRKGVDRGYLESYRPKPGECAGQMERVGRPPCTYTITAKGREVAKAGEVPGLKRGPKPKAAKAAPKAKAKPAKAKAKPAKAKAKPAKAKGRKSAAKPKPKRSKPATPPKAKARTEAEVLADKKAAKAKRDKASRARRKEKAKAAA